MTDAIREPYREVAAAIVIGTCGRLLLQQRDDIPGLIYAGLVGLFGGHREGTETPAECLRRELREETGLDFPEARFEPLVTVAATYPAGGGVLGTFYVLRDVPLDEVVITEGRPLVTTLDALPALLGRMTPTACYVARLYLEARRASAT